MSLWGFEKNKNKEKTQNVTGKMNLKTRLRPQLFESCPSDVHTVAEKKITLILDSIPGLLHSQIQIKSAGLCTEFRNTSVSEAPEVLLPSHYKK